MSRNFEHPSDSRDHEREVVDRLVARQSDLDREPIPATEKAEARRAARERADEELPGDQPERGEGSPA